MHPLGRLFRLRRETGLVNGGEESRGLLGGKAAFALVRHRLVAPVMRALDGGELDLGRLAVYGLALLGGEVLGYGFGPNLVQPHVAELAVALLALEAYGEIGRLVLGGAYEHAVVVYGVGEYLFLYNEGNVRHLELEADLGIGVQGIELGIVIGKERLLH